MSLNPADPSWKLLKNGNANNSLCTVTADGPYMKSSLGVSSTYNIGGTTNNCMSLISTAHIKPWENHTARPDGTPEQLVQPEATLIKLEIQFEESHGPLNGTAANAFGQGGIVIGGFVSYQNDQLGDPGYTGWNYKGAMVRKVYGSDPATYAPQNLYRAGHKTYFTYADNASPVGWSNQLNATSVSHDCIVFELGVPTRRNGNTGQNAMIGGSYSSTNPFGQTTMTNYEFHDNSTVTSNVASNGNYHHLWIAFGTFTSGWADSKIKRIRYCIQPLPSRVAI